MMVNGKALLRALVHNDATGKWEEAEITPDELLSEIEFSVVPKLNPPKLKKWIPVTEGVPKKEGLYLCTVRIEYDLVTLMYYKQKWDGGYGWVSYKDDYDHVYEWNVTAWMPIPDPYREEEG